MKRNPVTSSLENLAYGIKESEHIPPKFNDSNTQLTQLRISLRPQGQNTDQIKLDNLQLTRLRLELGRGTEEGGEKEKDNMLAGGRQADGEKEK